MSEPTNKRPVVPEGSCRFMKTRQLPATDAGFVGYETIWESFQTEKPYETPKRP